jgi:hypothetical protein
MARRAKNRAGRKEIGVSEIANHQNMSRKQVARIAAHAAFLALWRLLLPACLECYFDVAGHG